MCICHMFIYESYSNFYKSSYRLVKGIRAVYKPKIKAIKSKHNSDKNIHFEAISVAISAAVTSYARIYMAKVKLDILEKGGSIYYSDTDSIVTNIKLDERLTDLYSKGNKVLGRFKLEHELEEAYFISNKTYALITVKSGKDKIVKRAKGADKNALTLTDYKNMYENNESITTNINKATYNWYEASVVINK